MNCYHCDKCNKLFCEDCWLTTFDDTELDETDNICGKCQTAAMARQEAITDWEEIEENIEVKK